MVTLICPNLMFLFFFPPLWKCFNGGGYTALMSADRKEHTHSETHYQNGLWVNKRVPRALAFRLPPGSRAYLLPPPPPWTRNPPGPWLPSTAGTRTPGRSCCSRPQWTPTCPCPSPCTSAGRPCAGTWPCDCSGMLLNSSLDGDAISLPWRVTTSSGYGAGCRTRLSSRCWGSSPPK